MKNKMFLIAAAIISFLLSPILISGQDSTGKLINSSRLSDQDNIRKLIPLKAISLKGGSGEQEVEMPLRDSVDYINFEIKAVIFSGEVTVELYDPHGEKYGNFSIAGSQNVTDKPDAAIIRGKRYFGNASGSLVRFVKTPVRGVWKAKVFTKEAIGKINFNLTRGVVIFSIN